MSRYFLVTREDIDRIDSMLNALDLAITEVLEGRPVKSDFLRSTPAQSEFHQQANELIYRDETDDP